MPIVVTYQVKCNKCGTVGPAGFTSAQDAQARALELGWSLYPVLCRCCNARAKEATVTNKIAGLYLNLAKALNALEEAGEDPRGYDGSGVIVEGISGRVTYSPSGHVVEQA